MKYQLVSLKDGNEKEIDSNQFKQFMEKHKNKLFYKHKTKNNHLVYKNDDWMIFSKNEI